MKKFTLIFGILVLISILFISVSFVSAAKTESITKQSNTTIIRYNALNITNVDYLFTATDHEYYRFTVKDKYKDQYKIKNVVRTWEEDKNYTMTFNGNGKTSLTFRYPEDEMLADYTINYYTNNGVKNETISISGLSSIWQQTKTFKGKTANIKNIEKGNRGEVGPKNTIYNKFQIATKNKKYKIKYVLARYKYNKYANVDGKTVFTRFKGYGKRKLTLTTPNKYKQYSLTGLKIYYH